MWTLISKSENTSIIETRWVFRNKMDKLDKIIWNKARLVAQGYSQQKKVDCDETFALWKG